MVIIIMKKKVTKILCIILLWVFPVSLMLYVIALAIYPKYHKEALIRELADWEIEYSIISNSDDVKRSHEMTEYIIQYYIDYDSENNNLSNELKKQRQQTIASIEEAIVEYEKLKKSN